MRSCYVVTFVVLCTFYAVAADSSDLVQTILERTPVDPFPEPRSPPLAKQSGDMITRTVQELDADSSARIFLGAAVVLDRRQPAVAKYNDSVFPVDIVIAASLPTDSELASGFASARRDRDNGELKYTLRAIATNAPWVRKIFILINGNRSMPTWVPEPSKTEMVNRCTLLPEDLSLPPDKCTRNAAVVQTVVHKVKGLSEHFIYTDDDNLLCWPAHIQDFYSGDEPRYWGTHSAQLYNHPNNTGLSESQIPLTIVKADPVHTWFPLKKSSLEQFEKRYPEWFAFVRSHRVGRYCSGLNESGTEKSENVNSLEELLNQGIWWWWLKEVTAGGSDDNIGQSFRIGTYNERTWSHFRAHPPFIQNINDDMPISSQAYKAALHVMVSNLEEMFPDPDPSHASSSWLWRHPLRKMQDFIRRQFG